MAALNSNDLATVVARVKLITGDSTHTTLINQLVNDAAEQVLNFTHRTQVVDGLLKPIGDLAIVAYNRLGTEGESHRSEGGENYDFIEMPSSIYSILKGYRLARVCGNAYETESSDD